MNPRNDQMGLYQHCDNHLDREGQLRVDLPSIGVRRYLCDECSLLLQERLYCSYTNDYQEWERELNQGHEDRRSDMLDAYHGKSLSELKRMK